jgi:uncharacterized protein YbjT (DUF2867 family)
MSRLIAVTGATGNIGKGVAQRLLASGARVRAIARDVVKLRPLSEIGADAYPGSLEDVDFLTDALRGADAAFIMIPQHFHVDDYAADQRRIIGSVVAAVRASGVRKVVALSAVGASLRTGLSGVLAELEDGLKAIAGLDTVVLRAMFFMDNLLAAMEPIRNAGINGGIVRADVALPMIATRDVAEVAASLLTTLEFHGFTIRELVGPRALTNPEATAIVGAAIGVPALPYVEFPSEGMHAQLIATGFSRSAADAFVAMFTAVNDGRIVDSITPELAVSTPTTIEEFASQVFAPAYQHNG